MSSAYFKLTSGSAVVGLSRAQSIDRFCRRQVRQDKFLGELVKIDTSNPPGKRSELRAIKR